MISGPTPSAPLLSKGTRQTSEVSMSKVAFTGVLSPSRTRLERWTMRMRNRGGFRLPPSIPHDPEALHQAVQLLGNATQRRLRPETMANLRRLLFVDETDTHVITREKAQEWKATLEQHLSHIRSARSSTSHVSFEYSQHSEYPELQIHQRLKPERDGVLKEPPNVTVFLPRSDSRLSRAFVLLEMFRQKDGDISHDIHRQLRDLIGASPQTVRQAHCIRRWLARQAAIRRRRERRPEFIQELERRPLCVTKEHIANLKHNLGLLQQGRPLGSNQTEFLQSVQGFLPRTPMVARRWRASVLHVDRKRRKLLRNIARQQIAQEKRHRRAQKRMMRDRFQMVAPSMTLTDPAMNETSV
mmetsp:Transcript_4715/g.9522  ORF Transcript_4715/g.9522 Transcript_4715/m.9522 type:complete len:356 (-) Transcript_4715:1087-2154(-)